MRLILFTIPFFFLACSNSKIIEAKPDPVIVEPTPCENGTVAFIKPLALDGCTWIIELPEGEQLEPINYKDYLSEEEINSQKPLKVNVAFYDTKSASICMLGRTVAISCLERLK
jgi:hypothetical protein